MILAGVKLFSARTQKYKESVLEANDNIYSARRLKLVHTKSSAKSDFSGIMLKLEINESK